MTTYKKPQPVMVLGAITTGLTVIFGGLTTVAGLERNPTVALVAGIGMLTTAAINASKDYWLKEQVVPLEDTAAYRDATGTIVAGPAGKLTQEDVDAALRGKFDRGGDLPPREITEDDLR